jgi:hypothetical protein
MRVPTLTARHLSRPLKRALVAVCAPMLAISVLVATGGTALANSTDSFKCTFGSSSGNTKTCMGMDNQGLDIIATSGWATIETSARTLNVRLIAPNGSILEFTGWISVQPNHTITTPIYANPNAPAGNYCVHTLRSNNPPLNTNYTIIGSECYSVSS